VPITHSHPSVPRPSDMGTGCGRPGMNERGRVEVSPAGPGGGEKAASGPQMSTVRPHSGDLAEVLIFLVRS
jgi:hypothetical protein